MKNNQKHERFTRLFNVRAEKVIKAIEVLGNCSNRSAYEYTEDEVRGTLRLLEEKVRQVESRFEFEKPVSLLGHEDRFTTWKDLAGKLHTKGSMMEVFSKVQWGNNCIKFFIKDSPFWITCFSADFKDHNKRRYGVFISYSGFFDDDKAKSSQLMYINSFKSLIQSKREQLSVFFPNSYFFGDKDSSDSSLVDTVLNQGDFSSDDDAINQLAHILDLYVEHIVPLIKEL